MGKESVIRVQTQLIILQAEPGRGKFKLEEGLALRIAAFGYEGVGLLNCESSRLDIAANNALHNHILRRELP
jgi:hypothetical protein